MRSMHNGLGTNGGRLCDPILERSLGLELQRFEHCIATPARFAVKGCAQRERAPGPKRSSKFGVAIRY